MTEERKPPPIHPGEVLDQEFLLPMGITQYRLARAIGVDARRIHSIVQGKRAITAETALLLARYFGNSPGFWMGMQSQYDLEVTQDRISKRLCKIHQRHHGNDESNGRQDATLSETRLLSARYRHVLRAINLGRTDPIDIAYLAHYLADQLNLKRISDLEEIMSGTREPSFEFSEQFAQALSVNPLWLKTGRGRPFSQGDFRYWSPLDFLANIASSNARQIHLIKDEDPRGRAVVLLEITDLKYVFLDCMWIVSSEVGMRGQELLLNSYDFIKTLKDEGYSCTGSILEREHFDDLVSGKRFPGLFVNRSHSFWWDDFLDVHWEFFSPETYARKYGEEYVKAQRIVGHQLRLRDRRHRTGTS